MFDVIDQNEAIKVRKRGRPERDMEPILLAAITIFAREGYGATTIENIAAEAHVSSATLYKRFVNKQGLFEAVLAATTQRSQETHLNHRKVQTGPFCALLGRLEAHCMVSSDPRVRGVMRAWISEVNRHAQIGDIFARKSGTELANGVNKLLLKLVDAGLVDLGPDQTATLDVAGQMMLGIVERYTLMRGLVLGDNVAPARPPEALAYLAVQAMIGVWGTPKGKSAFKDVVCQSAVA